MLSSQQSKRSKNYPRKRQRAPSTSRPQPSHLKSTITTDDGTKRQKTHASKAHRDNHSKIKGVPATLSPFLISAVKACRPPRCNNETQSQSLTVGIDIGGEEAKDALLSHIIGSKNPKKKRKNSFAGETCMASSKTPRATTAAALLEFITELRKMDNNGRVCIASLSFLLDIVISDDDNNSMSVRVRRGALKVAFELLQRSCACREFFCSSSSSYSNDKLDRSWGGGGGQGLKRFVQMLAHHQSTASSSSSYDQIGKDEEDEEECLRKEATEMLTSLTSKFGQFYPRLIVSVRYIAEKRGIVDTYHANAIGGAITTASSSSSSLLRTRMGGGLTVYALRVGRDAAVDHGERECTVVMNIVRKVDECLQILMPRFAIDDDGEGGLGGAGHGDEDDEDDVDWEDGNDDGEQNEKNKNASRWTTSTTRSEHEMAVERTIAAMMSMAPSSSGGMGYSVEVVFGSHSPAIVTQGRSYRSPVVLGNEAQYFDDLSDDFDEEECFFFQPNDECVDGNNNQSDEKDNEKSEPNDIIPVQKKAAARKSLRLFISTLSRRHVPRLNLWIEALTTADDSPLQRNGTDDGGGENSLETQPSQTAAAIVPDRRVRGLILQKLMDARAAAAGCIATASRLPTQEGGERDNTTSLQEHIRPRRPRSKNRPLVDDARNRLLMATQRRKPITLGATFTAAAARGAKLKNTSTGGLKIKKYSI